MPAARGRRENPRARPTMADVGRLAGVSPTAVSFVINGRHGEISRETRDRVLDAVRALGYRPNRAARGLRTRRSHTIGVLVDPVDGGTAVARAVAGAHDAAAEHGSRLLLAQVPGGNGLRPAVEDLLDRQVDALLVAAGGATALPPPELVPAVLVGVADAYGTPAVLPAERAGARAATELLLRAGHRHIGVLLGPAARRPAADRLAGHREALAGAGLAFDPALAPAGPDRLDTGYTRTTRLLGRSPRPTALLCGTDRVAAGAYLALAEAGMRVPRDMSVLGWDDGPGLAAELRPALSTVHLPYYEMGRWGVQRLLLATADWPGGPAYLPCPVIRRASVGPPAEDAAR